MGKGELILLSQPFAQTGILRRRLWPSCLDLPVAEAVLRPLHDLIDEISEIEARCRRAIVALHELELRTPTPKTRRDTILQDLTRIHYNRIERLAFAVLHATTSGGYF